MVDCLSCQSCCGSLRSSKHYPKEKRPLPRKRAAQKLYLQRQNENSNIEKSKLIYVSFCWFFVTLHVRLINSIESGVRYDVITKKNCNLRILHMFMHYFNKKVN